MWCPEKCSGLWRSEDMTRLNLIVQREVLHSTVLEVGMLGKVQFEDMNAGLTAFARPFTNELRRCEDTQRKLRLIEDFLDKEPALQAKMAADHDKCATVAEMRDAVLQEQMDVVEDRIESTLSELTAMTASVEGFQHELNEAHEVSLLYQRVDDILHSGSAESDDAPHSSSTHRTSITADALAHVSSIFGLIEATKSEDLFKLCYRVTRGNAIVDISNEPESFLNPRTGASTVLKVSFTVLCSSQRMMQRLRHLVSALGASLYSLEEIRSRGEELHAADGRVHDVDSTSRSVLRRRQELLGSWYDEHRVYKCYLRVERSVLTTMNLCALSGATSSVAVWVPRRHEQALQRALESAVVAANGSVHSILSPHPNCENPPTYFETNWFTECFQSIVDSYGMARYKEVNPGVFTIITFPYLFGIMYGDIGHGFILLLVSLFLISKQREWKAHQLNEMVAMIFGGRFLLLLMSLFAIYMGVLYNDFFGFSLNLFKSGYVWANIEEEHGTTYPVSPNGLPSVKPDHVYAMGLDAAWAETENKLEFYNSVKMKHAVIVGVVQMFAGLFLSLNNSLYRKDWAKIGLLFVPEFVFLLCTFGYMSILIIIKWCTTWTSTNDAPSILEMMTNFFLQPGTVSKPLFKGQSVLQVILLLLAFAMVPPMLLGMPILEYKRFKQWKTRQAAAYPAVEGDSMHSYPPSELNRGGSGSATVFDGNDSGVQPRPRAPIAPLFSTGAGPAETANNRGSDEESTGDLFGDEAASSVLANRGRHTNDIFFPDTYDAEMAAAAAEDAEFEHFDFSEVMIHYIIHTIEYVLSSVSNTASYLRLWALSLAHAQLSEVFLSFTIVTALGASDSTGIAVAVGVLLWLGATLAVLVGMEALSAFLHALRLHWVEFQNKFYTGDGRAFEPLDLLEASLQA